MKKEIAYMEEALHLARLAEGFTWPNPMVGAVIVQKDVIVGRGYHHKAGTPHAEVHALREAGPAAKGATVYVTLEPCSHFGRTPPCADALIEAGVAEVYVAVADPNEKVDGIGRLEAAGIKIHIGLLGKDSFILNEVFMMNMLKRRAFIALKSAQSLDGRIALTNGESKWITGDAARQRTHRLRRRYGAVLVGVDTVIADDPLLNIRYGLWAPSGAPTRIVLDSHLRMPRDARILDVAAGPVLVYTGKEYDRKKAAELEEKGVQIISLPDPDGRVSLADLPYDLYRRGVGSVLVEGGSRIATAFFCGGHWDKYHCFIAPKFLGPGGKEAFALPPVDHLSDAKEITLVAVEKIDKDILVECEPKEGIGQCLPGLLKKRAK